MRQQLPSEATCVMEQTKTTTIDAYIAAFPVDKQEVLSRIRKLVKDCAPEATEAMAYGIPTFRLHGNLVHFAAFKGHLGFYPSPSAILAFEKELKAYKTAKGTVQFPWDHPIPYNLIGSMVRFRVAEQGKKAGQ